MGLVIRGEQVDCHLRIGQMGPGLHPKVTEGAAAGQDSPGLMLSTSPDIKVIAKVTGER
jgi:hypothetical protein